MFKDYGSTVDNGLSIFGSAEAEFSLNQLYGPGDFQKWTSQSNFRTKMYRALGEH